MIAPKIPSIARKAFCGALEKRLASDLSITRTGKPIARTEGGRSSLGGHTVAIFGATGQLGRYVVNRLARRGCTVVIPFREEMAKRHLKVAGDLGKVIFIEFDLRNTASIEACVQHADTVYNFIGRNYPTKNFSLEDVHVEGTERITEAVKNRVIRILRLEGPSRASCAAKLPGDDFTNNMKKLFWPVHSIDVGAALEKMLYDESTAGQTFELYGPKKYTMAQIKSMVDREIFKQRRHINVPKALLKPFAGLLNRVLWWNTLSADEVEREFIDQVIDRKAKTFEDLGMKPGDISNFTYHYLQGFRSSNFYDLPPATEKERKEEKKFIHVLNEL
ncbi:hypothetical protein XA68_11185 [Ophiocordyceps unilateralis]|uniref:NAD-dependent epimerase/dehydratase domain-containing protein n=1 Tax=Ophiocordyceps unilateralis TaxID=268505 RepID=A0A2A9P205_OPHUN|nr:hypothetical protein XA68_11185 [Ophiocordyceps unilateralis]